MDGWQQSGSNGEDFGDDAGDALVDQRNIAIEALRKGKGSFVVICNDEDGDGGLRCISAIWREDATDEELIEYGRQFLREAAVGIMNVLDNFTEES